MKRFLAVVGLLIIFGSLALTLVMVFSACPARTAPAAEVLEDTRFLLGTVVEVRLYDGGQDIFDPLFEEVRRLESLLSLNIEDSELNRINRAAGRAPVKVSPETFEVIRRGLDYSRLSGGRFDISIGPLIELWHIGYEDARVPGEEEIAAALPLISWTRVKLDEGEQTVFLEEPGMILDLGGIAKGYVADRMAAFLRQGGKDQALLNLGGNVLVVGYKGDGSDFRIGVQDPRDVRGSMVGILTFPGNRSVVSTGAYERFLQVGDRIYHHVLDPSTGYPGENSLLQATIVSEYSVDGDGLSTSVFLLGLEEGLALIESLPGAEAVLVDEDNRVYITSGLFESFTLTNAAYRPGNFAEGPVFPRVP
ncbi:MAG: FAD:protein FMN transferase [Spirochaetales bacterium]|jgi:thiamine biosynthesis lipoprotein|nr:FAD:protein FMN transferase [Spirochaetales bacterium]